MEFYSLEDEDVGDMFLTQQSSQIVPLIPSFEIENDMEVDDGKTTQKQKV